MPAALAGDRVSLAGHPADQDVDAHAARVDAREVAEIGALSVSPGMFEPNRCARTREGFLSTSANPIGSKTYQSSSYVTASSATEAASIPLHTER
jgi:hypothetical protein